MIDQRRICIFSFIFVGGNEWEGRIKIEATSNHDQGTILYPAKARKTVRNGRRAAISPVSCWSILSLLYTLIEGWVSFLDCFGERIEGQYGLDTVYIKFFLGCWPIFKNAFHLPWRSTAT